MVYFLFCEMGTTALSHLQGGSGPYFRKGHFNLKDSLLKYICTHKYLEREIPFGGENPVRKMEKGARHRNNAEKNHPGGSELEASQETGSTGGGVALKKEIGLVSACGIIVGESNSFFYPPLFPFSGGPLVES